MQRNLQRFQWGLRYFPGFCKGCSDPVGVISFTRTDRRFDPSEPPRNVAANHYGLFLARNAMATRHIGLRIWGHAALIAATAICCALVDCAAFAAWSTVVDNGSPANRVDIVFVGDGYTLSDLESGLYTGHVQQYLDYMFDASGYLADPFPRYQEFLQRPSDRRCQPGIGRRPSLERHLPRHRARRHLRDERNRSAVDD